jgi:methyl-accepting chemotaxis protein
MHTREELQSEIGTITRGLQDISVRIDGMSRESRGTTADARGSGGSFFAGMEEGLLGLTDAVREHAGIHGEMAKAVERVTSAVSGMEGFLRDIVRIGIEMKMIALNAAIHAAHVGDEGLALGVLAEHLHRLSNDTSQNIASIDQELKAVFTQAERLQRCAGQNGAGSVEERFRMTEELGRMIPVLKELNQQSVDMLESIDAGGKTLSAEIQDRAGDLHFDGILQAVDTLVSEIEREIARCELAISKQGGKGGSGGSTGSGIHKMAQVYTMEREREVHRAILGGEPPVEAEAVSRNLSLAAPGEEPAEEKKSGDDLGDNVELF